MRPGVVIAGYFLVAAAFFAVGRLTAGRSEAPAPAPSRPSGPEGSSQPIRLERLEVQPVQPERAAPLASPDPVIPPDVRPAEDPSPAIGPADAKVIVFEVSDFQCPVCKRAFAPLKQLASDFPGQVRLVFMQNPLKMHRNALNAAAAAMAAARQGRFWEYADRLFENQSALSEADLLRYASDLGLDPKKFEQDYRDPAIRARALAEGEAAMALGARGTPSFFVQGRMQVGWASYEAIRQMVEVELRATNELIAAGKSLKEARIERVRANLQDADRFLASPLGREFSP